MFNLFKRSKSPREPHERFGQLTDDEWLALLVRSVTEPVIDGIRMPGFPDDMLQRNTVGSAGEQALREAFTFISFVKKYARELGHPVNSHDAGPRFWLRVGTNPAVLPEGLPSRSSAGR